MGGGGAGCWCWLAMARSDMSKVSIDVLLYGCAAEATAIVYAGGHLACCCLNLGRLANEG